MYYKGEKRFKMEDKGKIEKVKKQYYKIYIDTLKHYQDIKKWLDKGSRKQGDIRRSLQRLSNKYDRLYKLKIELEKNKIEPNDIIPSSRDQENVFRLKGKIEDLYELAGIKEKSKPRYENIDLVSDIPDSEVTNKISYNRQTTEYFPRLWEKEENNLPEILKNGFYQIGKRMRKMSNHFKNKQEDGIKKKGKVTKRIAAFLMASSLAFFGSITTGENTSKSDHSKNDKSYVDIHQEKQNFKNSIYMQTLEDGMQTTTQSTAEITKHSIQTTKPIENKNESVEDKNIEESKQEKNIQEKVLLAHQNTQYTEVSDGTGNAGYFMKDTKVRVYNRALIKTEKDGSKTILKYTKVGQDWKQFAKENKISYQKLKEYMDTNENIKEYVSVQSEDGKTLYGWLSADCLEPIKTNDTFIEEVER